MAQIRNFGFIAPVQEPHLQHPSRPGGGLGQLGRQSESPEHALRHPHHTGAHRQGLGGYVPFRNDHQQLTDGAVPALQVPAPEGAGAAGHPLFRCLGGDFRQKDHRLRVQRDEQRGAEGTFPLLHQGARTCRLLQRDYRLPHGGGRGCGPSAQERDTAPHTAHARAGGLHTEADAVRQDGRCHAAGQSGTF